MAINPNDPKAVALSELGYTDVSDSLDEMKIRSEYRHFNFPYLWDGETQSVTQAYGAQATPHVFIFDKDRKLQYEGRIDNAQRESIVKIQDARLALDAMVAGKPVATPHTPSFGCSTKWKSKIDAGQAEIKSKTSLTHDAAVNNAQLATERTDVSFMLTGLLAAHFSVSPSTRLFLAATLDWDTSPRAYVLTGGPAETALIQSLEVRPGVTLGFAFNVARAGGAR